MAIYYVRKSGNDTTGNGQSPATAWATIGKALGAAGIASGDTVYIGAGTYREVVTVNMTAPTAETKVIGDVDGSKTGDGGEVVWTAYLTNDTTAPSTSPTLSTNGRPYLTFENITFIGGQSNPTVCNLSAGSNNITLRRCAFMSAMGNQAMCFATAQANTAHNLLVEECSFFHSSSRIFQYSIPTSASADYDMNDTFRNSLFVLRGGATLHLDTSGADAFKGGGLDIYNNTFFGADACVNMVNTNFSTTYPARVHNCLMVAAAMNAVTSGQIVEDYNILIESGRTNVTPGANTISGNARSMMLEIGQSYLNRLHNPRPYLMPMVGSPYLGFGNDATYTTATDFLGLPRPEGGKSTSKGVGYMERHDTAVKETTTVRTGSAGLSIEGPGSQEFEVAVAAGSATISVYGRYDTNHGTTNKPQLQIRNGAGCGVADQTATMTAAADTWEQLSLNISPTSDGIITVRLVSRAGAGNGKAFFDDWNIA